MIWQPLIKNYFLNVACGYVSSTVNRHNCCNCEESASIEISDLKM